MKTIALSFVFCMTISAALAAGPPTATSGFPIPLPTSMGGCGATTAAGCRTNIGAAASDGSTPFQAPGGLIVSPPAARANRLLNVIDDAGGDWTGATDSSAAFNNMNDNANAAAATGGSSDIEVPVGRFHLTHSINVGSATLGAVSRCLDGHGWASVIDISTDFADVNANGIINIVQSNAATQHNSQICIKNLRIVEHMAPDFITTTTAGASAGVNAITVADASGVQVNDWVYDKTNRNAIPTNDLFTAAGGAFVQGISGNTLTLSQNVASPGVSSGDTIYFAPPRASATTLAQGCSLTPGAPLCKYPWAIYNPGQENFSLDNVLFETVWDGLYQRGQTYNIGNIYSTAFDQTINQDAGHNISTLYNVKCWNGFGGTIGTTGNYAQAQVYYDGATVCANLGESDGVAISALQSWIGAVNLTSAWTRGQISNSLFDGAGANFTFSPANAGSFVEINNVYFTNSGNRSQTVAQAQFTNGIAKIVNSYMSSSENKPTLLVNGGAVYVSNSEINVLNVGGVAGASVTSGMLSLSQTRVDSKSSCGGNVSALVSQSSTGILKASNLTFDGNCTAQPSLQIGTDVAGNSLSNIDFNGGSFLGPTSFASGPVGSYQIQPRIIASGSSDIEKLTDTSIIWNSASGLAKSETVYGCSANNAGRAISVLDAFGDAGTNPITITPQGGTIGGKSSWAVLVDKGSISLTCDGVSNWRVSANNKLRATVYATPGSFTHTFASGLSAVDVYVQAAGAAGGSGAVAASGTATSGGGGGGAGHYSEGHFVAADLNPTAAIVVGQGGVGGTAVASGAGNNGTAGGSSSFTSKVASLKPFGGGYAAGGQIGTPAGFGAGGSFGAAGGNASGAASGTNTYGSQNAPSSPFYGSNGGAGASGANGGAAAGAAYGASGGGAGGGIPATAAFKNGGASGYSAFNALNANGVAGGSTDGAAGGVGVATGAMQPGIGGGGGASSILGDGGAGGAGVNGGGGAGGGSALTGSNSGPGGGGGNGLVGVVEHIL